MIDSRGAAMKGRHKWRESDYWGTTLPPFPCLRGALTRLRGFHQNPLGLGVLDPVHELVALVHVADRLGHGNAGLDEHHDAHREVALDPEVERQEEDADADHEGRTGKRGVGEADPG